MRFALASGLALVAVLGVGRAKVLSRGQVASPPVADAGAPEPLAIPQVIPTTFPESATFCVTVEASNNQEFPFGFLAGFVSSGEYPVRFTLVVDSDITTFLVHSTYAGTIVGTVSVSGIDWSGSAHHTFTACQQDSGASITLALDGSLAGTAAGGEGWEASNRPTELHLGEGVDGSDPWTGAIYRYRVCPTGDWSACQ